MRSRVPSDGEVPGAGCPVPSRAVRTDSWHAALGTGHYAALMALLILAPAALACPVCFGAPGDPMVKGVNNGIWVLLGLVAFVQIGFGALFFSFWRRGRAQRKFRESLTVIDGGVHH